MRIEVDLPPQAAESLLEAERRWGLTRERALAVCIVAGASELTAGYVERLLEWLDGQGDNT